MEYKFRAAFLKDVSKLDDKKVKQAIADVVQNVEESDSIKDLKNCKKMKDFQNAFRIRIGDYRIGIFIEKEVVEFTRVLHRKEVYRYFP